MPDSLEELDLLLVMVAKPRTVRRLFVQIERILKINELSLVTDDVVEAARSTLVIGAN